MSARVIESVVNTLLAADAETARTLEQFAGTVVEVNVLEADSPSAAVGSRLFIELARRQVRVFSETEYAQRHPQGHVEGAPQVVISATGAALMRLLSRRGGPVSGVRIEGDMALVQALSTMAQRYHLDWEEHLARIFGDLPAHQMGKVAREFFAWGAKAQRSWWESFSEYLTEELRVSVATEEVDGFAREVDRIRDDVERLEQRFSRIVKRARAASED